jgi:hypothetical protein
MLRAVASRSETRIICTRFLPFLANYRFAAMSSNTTRTTPRKPAGASPRLRGTVKDHLAAADAFARIAEQASRLQRLQVLLDAALPAYLLPGTRIANLKRGKVVIHADSGAVAVKLRQLAPRLAEGFIQQGQEVTGIEVRVQARRRPPAGPRQKAARTIAPRSKQALTSLASGLEEDSPVRRAIEKLLRNT